MVDYQTSSKSTSYEKIDGSRKLAGADSENGGGSQSKLKTTILRAVECLPDEHKLEFPYVFSYFAKPKANFQPADYAHYVTQVAVIQSVEQFWAAYQHLQRPQDLPEKTDYHVFKLGIEPVWEHPQNCNGGKWILRLRKGLSSRIWENLLLAMIGEQFNVGDEICGAVCSVRNTEDIISLWNRSGNNTEYIYRIRDVLRRVLNLPNNILLEYKKHNDCLKDQSSYRHAKAV